MARVRYIVCSTKWYWYQYLVKIKENCPTELSNDNFLKLSLRPFKVSKDFELFGWQVFLMKQEKIFYTYSGPTKWEFRNIIMRQFSFSYRCFSGFFGGVFTIHIVRNSIWLKKNRASEGKFHSFSRTISLFLRSFFRKFWPYVWLVFKSGL